MTTKKELQAKLDALGARLSDESRAYQAFCEWFICSNRGHATNELDVMIDDRVALTVVVHGMSRAAGGVAVVKRDDYQDFPRYLDDLIAEWSRDAAREIRDAAALLSKRRNQLCAVAPTEAT